jgi:hypothetical protein
MRKFRPAWIDEAIAARLRFENLKEAELKEKREQELIAYKQQKIINEALYGEADRARAKAIEEGRLANDSVKVR